MSQEPPIPSKPGPDRLTYVRWERFNTTQNAAPLWHPWYVVNECWPDVKYFMSRKGCRPIQEPRPMGNQFVFGYVEAPRTADRPWRWIQRRSIDLVVWVVPGEDDQIARLLEACRQPPIMGFHLIEGPMHSLVLDGPHLDDLILSLESGTV